MEANGVERQTALELKAQAMLQHAQLWQPNSAQVAPGDEVSHRVGHQAA